ncbi:MAG: sigma-54-dependent Fis family transcriptional regulator [Gammaproteobacteria bacterium]|nr:sigma-54-dependent Fis family transcriptional regulator [Gammaproteobacteria bacterium]
MSRPTALLIDDEPDILELLSITLERMGINCDTVSDVSKAKQSIKSNQYDLCLTDMKLPDGDGLEIVDYLQEMQSDVPVAVITAHGNMQTAIEAMKRGAFDFISKPVDLSNLRLIITNALKVKPKSNEQENSPSSLLQLIGETSSVKQLKQLILKVANSQAPLYVRGESGTGKELVARLVHENGPRKNEPFVAINCGAIPSELMESELFGHKKGSFSGATQDKDGLFKSADGGTLFLDEVADLPLSMQVKLLRAIQERSIRPVGSEKEVPVNIRLLSASHKDLNDLVAKGSFRQDLYYRINVIEIQVPPLRERIADLPLLIDHIAKLIAKRNGISKPTIESSVVDKLQKYLFPGNVRELENILERAITLSLSDTISPEDIQLEQPNGSSQESMTGLYRGEQSLDDFLESIERKEIEQALEITNGNKTAAAEKLGISFRAMRYKCKKLNIE